jgi:hypothetical protein
LWWKKSQNKKRKVKKPEGNRDDRDDDKDPVRSVKIDEGDDHDKDIIEILRNRKGFLIANDYHLIYVVDWTSLADML